MRIVDVFGSNVIPEIGDYPGRCLSFMNTRRVVVFAIGSALWVAVIAMLFFGNHDRSVSDGVAERSGEDGAVEESAVEVPRLKFNSWSKDGLPDFELVNQDGKKVRKSDLLGTPWIASFIFTRCAGSCPKVANQLRVLQDRLANVPVKLVSISVQPESDTPEVLRRYAQNLNADSAKWTFLTGDKGEIHRLVAAGFLQYVAPSRASNPEPGWEVEHSNNLCLVDATGVVVGKYNSLNDGEVSLLRKDLTRLLSTGSLDAGSMKQEGESLSSEK